MRESAWGICGPPVRFSSSDWQGQQVDIFSVAVEGPSSADPRTQNDQTCSLRFPCCLTPCLPAAVIMIAHTPQGCSWLCPSFISHNFKVLVTPWAASKGIPDVGNPLKASIPHSSSECVFPRDDHLGESFLITFNLYSFFFFFFLFVVWVLISLTILIMAEKYWQSKLSLSCQPILVSARFLSLTIKSMELLTHDRVNVETLIPLAIIISLNVSRTVCTTLALLFMYVCIFLFCIYI